MALAATSVLVCPMRILVQLHSAVNASGSPSVAVTRSVSVGNNVRSEAKRVQVMGVADTNCNVAKTSRTTEITTAII
jgi:hypothetical protein